MATRQAFENYKLNKTKIMNFSGLTIQRIIVHKIFEKGRKETHSSVELKDELIIADEEVKDIIIERFMNVCGEGGRALELEIANSVEGSFFQLAKGLRLSNDQDFIKYSGQIAVRLAESQKRIAIPDSYLLVVDACSNTSSSIVIVVKAELQKAIKPSIDNRGLEIVKDVFLSPATKLFKIGVLYSGLFTTKTYPNDEYGCLLFDHTFSTGDRLEPAEYFCNDFLGFTVDNNASIRTKKFFEYMKSFVSEYFPYDKQKAILSLLKNHYELDTAKYLDPKKIEDSYIPDELKSFYQQHISPHFPTPFVIDTALMKETLQKRKVYFQNNISLVGPEGCFDENIEIINDGLELQELLNSKESGFTLIKIKGTPVTSNKRLKYDKRTTNEGV